VSALGHPETSSLNLAPFVPSVPQAALTTRSGACGSRRDADLLAQHRGVDDAVFRIAGSGCRRYEDRMSGEDTTAARGERVDPQLLTVLTTEHFVLQTARGATISEANGRAAIYLGTLSSGLIALGFVAGDQRRFPAFVAVVLPAVLVLGLFTFVRMVATSVESVRYLIRVQRIRAWYRQLAPDGSWFADANPGGVDADDEAASALTTTGIRPGPLQMLYTAAAMVAAMNAIVLGTIVSLLLRAVDLLELPPAVTMGVLLGFAAFLGQLTYQRRQYSLGAA